MSVQRVFANGKLSEYPKTDRSRRRVPLRSRVLEAIDKTYGHLAPDADAYELGLLDAFDARTSASTGHLLDTAD